MWVYKSAFYLRTNDFGNQSLFSLPGLLQSFLWHLTWDSGVTRSQGPSLSQVAFQQQHPASPHHPGRRLCPSHCPCCHTRVWCGGEERQGAGAGECRDTSARVRTRPQTSQSAPGSTQPAGGAAAPHTRSGTIGLLSGCLLPTPSFFTGPWWMQNIFGACWLR